MSRDTPWYGFSGDGERTFAFALLGGSNCADIFRSTRGDGGGPMSPLDAIDARDGCWSRAGSSGERREGRPLTDAPVAWLPNALVYGVSSRPTGELRGGRPVGDARCFASSRAALPAAGRLASSGTARLALLITGDAVGESFGKRVAAAEGDMSDAVDVDAVFGWCVLSAIPAGFAGAPGAGPFAFALPMPIAS